MQTKTEQLLADWLKKNDDWMVSDRIFDIRPLIADILVETLRMRQELDLLRPVCVPSDAAARDYTTVNLDQEYWTLIKQAASESKWITKEYYVNDWVADICLFLREGSLP